MHSLRLPVYFGRIREGKTALNLGALLQDVFAKDKRGQEVERLWAHLPIAKLNKAREKSYISYLEEYKQS